MALMRQPSAMIKTVVRFTLLGITTSVILSLGYFYGSILSAWLSNRVLQVYLRLPEVQSALLYITLKLILTFALLGGMVGASAGALLHFLSSREAHANKP